MVSSMVNLHYAFDILMKVRILQKSLHLIGMGNSRIIDTENDTVSMLLELYFTIKRGTLISMKILYKYNRSP